jgi:hypothetical protein
MGGNHLRRSIRVLLVGATLGLAFAVINPLAKAESGLKLHPNGFGEKSYAAWKAQEGLPDSKGNADHALYFQKMTTTATFAAGVARITGLEGQPATVLTGLSWEHRLDGHCGAGAPRWNIRLQPSTGPQYTVFLGCAAAPVKSIIHPGWMLDSYPGLAIQAAIEAAGSAEDTIVSLAIVFDEGNDVGQGYVFLDNITVNGHTWTSPADNGK